MLINALIVKRCTLSVLLFTFAIQSQAQLSSDAPPSAKQIQAAITNFVGCVKSEQALIISKDHQICGVTAENRTELLEYISCLAHRNFIYTTVLERDSLNGMFEYRCSDQISVVVKVERKRNQFVVTGIGYLIA